MGGVQARGFSLLSMSTCKGVQTRWCRLWLGLSLTTVNDKLISGGLLPLFLLMQVAMLVPRCERFGATNPDPCHPRGTGSVHNAIFRIVFAKASIANGSS